MLRDEIRCCDAVEGLTLVSDGCIPMALSSPPYGDLRDYGSHQLCPAKFRAIADELWRVLTPGGVVAWVVQDPISDGGEAGAVDEQKAYFRSLGFKLYQTIYVVSTSIRPTSRRYDRQTSLALIFSKGRPRAVNLLRDRRNATAGQLCRLRYRNRDGTISRRPDRIVRTYGKRTDVWVVHAGWGKSTRDFYAFEHPAMMPEALAGGLILSWSRPGDVVLDPMSGAGTTAKMALLNHRRYLGFEVHEPYHRLAVRRLDEAHGAYRRRLDAALGEV